MPISAGLCCLSFNACNFLFGSQNVLLELWQFLGYFKQFGDLIRDSLRFFRCLLDGINLRSVRRLCLSCLASERLFIQDAFVELLLQFSNRCLVLESGIKPSLPELSRLIDCVRNFAGVAGKELVLLV